MTELVIDSRISGENMVEIKAIHKFSKATLAATVVYHTATADAAEYRIASYKIATIISPLTRLCKMLLSFNLLP